MFIGLSLALIGGIAVLTDSIMVTSSNVHLGYFDPTGEIINLESKYVLATNIVFKMLVSFVAVLVLVRFNSTFNRSYIDGIVAIFIIALLSRVPYGQIYAIGAWYYPGIRGFLDRFLVLGSFENTVLSFILACVLIYAVSRHFPPIQRQRNDGTPEDVEQTGSTTIPESTPGAHSPQSSP